MFCSNCGKEVNEGQAICLNCGFEIKKVGNSGRGWWDNINRNGKTRGPAFLISAFLATTGIHRIYMGADWKATMFILFLLGFVTMGATWVISGIWGLIDFIRIIVASPEEFETLFLKPEVEEV